ncbi:carbohydrate-binding protein [Gracilibacillus boraciitolerans]|uniref:carbohydrate-binding protein n=1 Tax=Gracilibacillus boraciitolerans TaxID=307521 RepID=UPI00130ED0B2|nr:CBM35 domain-containing protein [Gracilibacillus boraciitolerans]
MYRKKSNKFFSIFMIVVLLLSMVPNSIVFAEATRNATPPTVAPNDATLIEGETATRTDAWTGTDRPYSGTGFAILDGSRDSSKISYNINVDSEGEYSFAFNYSAGPVDGWPTERSIILNVNGQEETLLFTGTNSWDEWEYLIKNVNLNTGDNTISLTTDGSTNGANIDYLYYWKVENEEIVQSIQFKNSTINITKGDNFQSIVQAIYDDNSIKDLNLEKVSFSSAEENIATVSETGKITAVDVGSTEITAAYENFSATTTVVVEETGVPANARVIQGGESGTITHGPATDQNGYTGSGFAVINHELVPSSASYDIEVGSSGEFNINLRYAAGFVSGSSDDRTVGLFVNGSKVRDIVFEGTTQWNNWQLNRQVVSLNEGKNTVMLKVEAAGNGIVLDKLTLWKNVSEPEVYSYQFDQEEYQVKESATDQVTMQAISTDETIEDVTEALYLTPMMNPLLT